MAQQPQDLAEGGLMQQQNLYPPPPPYFSLAADGNLAPPPLIEGEYVQFGEIFTTEDGLPALQVRRLYDTLPDGSIDIKGQLLALHRELTVNFLELLEVLIERPSAYARQVENLGLILRNMMFLANQLRPVQARATVLETLSATLKAKTQAIEKLHEASQGANRALDKAIEVLKATEAATRTVENDGGGSGGGDGTPHR